MLCLIAAGMAVPLLSASVTLAWTHSVERIAWEEDWRSTPAGLELVEARVRGSGAGMEPPQEARLVDGVWRWRPTVPTQGEVVLRRSGATADWRICLVGTCRPMTHYLPEDADPVTLTRCEAPG
jgi:hypothetical protein